MDRSDVQAWLDRYIEAWRSGDANDIAELFGEDVAYRYNPYFPESRWLRGRYAVVSAWLDEKDEPGSWEAAYAAYAVDHDRAVATGISRYFATGDTPEQTYHNVFLLRFDDDHRCTEFIDYFMLENPPPPG
jgi:ketosteroid isomerase-like protein